MTRSKTVFAGMSGGVDSSVTAALLKEQDYYVVGVYMKNWTQDMPGFVCPWKEDFQDAKRVAVQLGIELLVFDFENEYRQKVVDYMIDEYKAGRTPNPDIKCNQEIKFKLFLETALEHGADMIATGHYARVTHKDRRAELHTAANLDKDQTYFLYRVTEKALNKSLFPIGEYKSKDEVRSKAADFKLSTADKRDSQGICFVGKVGIKEFLLNELGPQPAGYIIDQAGKNVGEHDGAIFYTTGQRHGLNVGGGLPYYVTHKDMKTNTVNVTADLQDKALWSDTIKIRDIHWINEAPVDKKYQVRLRYRGPLIQVKVEVKGREAVLKLGEAQRATAAGQSAVIYDGDRVVGGGIIFDVSSL